MDKIALNIAFKLKIWKCLAIPMLHNKAVLAIIAFQTTIIVETMKIKAMILIWVKIKNFNKAKANPAPQRNQNPQHEEKLKEIDIDAYDSDDTNLPF